MEKGRALTLVHERGELLDGLLRGGRHCRRRSLQALRSLVERSNGEKAESYLPF
jgi:hypothetical protein